MIDEYQSAPVTPVAPSLISIKPTPACDTFVSYREAAAYWFNFGFNVIPIIPGKKIPAVKWDEWLDDLSIAKIAGHWTQNLDHEIGFIVGDDIVVFDADSPESIAALAEIEKVFGVTPNLRHKTKKGVHNFYKRAVGTHAKSDSHSTDAHPERIDVKTGRALIILPPSKDKSIALREADNAGELTEASQDFIDAVFRHNGRVAPCTPEGNAFLDHHPFPSCRNMIQLFALLDYSDPDSGYDDWLRVLMVIFYTTGGGEEGLYYANRWSSKGRKYKGIRDIVAKWDSFRLDHPYPVTLATLKWIVAANGHDWVAICSAAEDRFARGNDKTGLV